MSHSFNEKTFSQLTFCDNCKQLLWGLRRQGLQCEDCGYTCHHNCQKTAAKCSFKVSQGFLRNSKVTGSSKSKSNLITTSNSKAENYLKRISQHNGIEAAATTSNNAHSKTSEDKRRPSVSSDKEISSKQQQTIDLVHLRAIITSQKFHNIVLDAIVDNPIPLNSYLSQQPPLNPQTTTVNFTRFVSRCGPVFAFRDELLLLLSWKNPVDTLLAMLSYCFICLYPKLLLFIPQCVLIYYTLSSKRTSISSSTATKTTHNNSPPPLQQHLSNLSKLVQPAIENSPEYLHNLQNLQNNMGEFSDLYDWVLLQHANYFDWSSEKRTASMVQALLLSILLMALTLHFISVRYIFLFSGIMVFLLNTRFAKYMIHELEPYWSRFQKQCISAWKAWYEGIEELVQVEDKHIEISIYENQRWCSTRQRFLSPQTLNQNERLPALSNYSGAAIMEYGIDDSATSLEDILPPQDYQWEQHSNWTLDKTGPWVDTVLGMEIVVIPDKEGWVYSNDHWNIQQGEPLEADDMRNESTAVLDPVVAINRQTRRRRWYRKCQRI